MSGPARELGVSAGRRGPVKMPKRLTRAAGLLLIVVVLGLTGACSHLGYYAQAIGGHFSVMRAARPIDELLRDGHLDPVLRSRLEKALQIREFSVRELGLPDNGSYRRYADVGRPYVVWNVFAAPELSLTAETWCLLVVGCVGYRGYYDRGDAEALAAELRAKGLETHVAGIPAYSTLGWFDDPLLNTFVVHGEIEIARLVFHELAHQLIYVSGDTSFNESFAVSVENEGMRRWLAANPALARHYELHGKRREAFFGLLERHRARLTELYAGDLPAGEKRLAKAALYRGLREEWRAATALIGSTPAFDKWFDEDLNNARIASLALYSQLVPAFDRMLAEEGRNLPRFYARVRALAAHDKAERRVLLGAGN